MLSSIMLGLVSEDQADMTSYLEELTLCCHRSSSQQRNYHLEGIVTYTCFWSSGAKICPLKEGALGGILEAEPGLSHKD